MEDPINSLSYDDIRIIFTSIKLGVNNHGSFLVNFARAITSADYDNLQILRNVALDLIEKYQLYRPEYRPL